MSKNKKIGIVVNAYWNINNYRRGLINALRKEGYKIYLFSPVEEGIDLSDEDCCKIVRLKFLSRRSTNPFKDLLFFFELYIKFLIHKPELLLLYTPKPNIYGSLAAAWTGRKSIATLTGLGYSFISGNVNFKIISRLYKFAFKHSNHVFFHNQDDRELFTKNAWISEKKSSTINGSGVDVDFFKAMKKTEENKNFRFLFMGRLLYDKGINELIDAFIRLNDKIKNVELFLLAKFDDGNPSSIKKELMNKWLEDYPNIHHKEACDDVRPYIANADAIVLPSYREGMPKSVLEAMAMGKAIIVSDVAGCRQTIGNTKPVNGFLCTVKDSLSLATKMEQMISLNEQQRLQMGKSGRQLVLDLFDEKIIHREYLHLIEEILESSET